MRKRKGRSTALFLVFCMVLSMFSAIPARAARDENDDVYGLIAVDWLDSYYDEQDDCEKIFVGEDDCPAELNRDENGNPNRDENGELLVGDSIPYLDWKEASIVGVALWLEYRSAVDEEKTHISDKDITAVEYSATNPDEEPENVNWESRNKEDLIAPYSVKTNKGKKDLALFQPNEPGYYRFTCADCSNNDDQKLIVHVDYPEIGFYSKAEMAEENLYCTDIYSGPENVNYDELSDKPNEIYVNLHSRYPGDEKIELGDFELTNWDDNGVETVSSEEFVDEQKTVGAEYMSVEELSKNEEDSWYKITFNEALFSKGGFDLRVHTQKFYKNWEEENGDPISEEWPPEAWLGGSVQPYGLVIAEWLDTYWDDAGEKILVDDNGYPAQAIWSEDEDEPPAPGEPIPYVNYKEVSIPESDKGFALWIKYRDFSDGTEKYISEEAITDVEYSEDKNDWTSVKEKGLIGVYSAHTSNGDENLVLFKPDEPGYYRIACKDCSDDEKLIVHVDYPEIGFYSKKDMAKENLYYPADNHFWYDWNGCDDYTGLIEDNQQSTIYVNLYNRYSDSVTLKECELSFWDEEEEKDITLKGNYDVEEKKLNPAESEDGSTTVDGKDITNYMSVEPEPESDNGWYKITFKEDLCLEGDFGLGIKAEKQYGDDSEPQDVEAWLNGSFRQSGLCVTSDESDQVRDQSSGEAVMSYSGGLYPDTAELKFGHLTKDNNGKVVYTPLSNLSKDEIKIFAKEETDGEESEEPKWRPVKTPEESPEECDCKWEWNEKDAALEIMFYYQQDYKITIGGESVYVHPYLDDIIEFFTEPERPDQPNQRADKRIRGTIKVDEGKPKTVYALSTGVDIAKEFATDMEKAEITVTLKDGTPKDYNDYIEVNPLPAGIDKNVVDGREIIIKDQVKEDFCIKVAANLINSPDPDWTDQIRYENTLTVEINKGSSLTVKNQPKKTVYTEGETFDPTGMTIEMAYEDESIDPIEIKDYTITPAGPLKTTDKYVTVEYHGKTTTQPIPITVNAKPQQPTTEQPTTQQPTTEQPTTQAPPAAQPSAEGTVLSPQETGEKAEFTVTSDDSADPTVAYKETTEKKEKSVTIPNTVEVNGVTYKVTSIADNAFKGNKTVTKVTVGSNITSIGKNAFANCKKLKTVTVSKNVTDVGDNAFKGCTALTKVTLPAKTKKIGKNAFSGCKKLKTLTIKSKDLTSKTVSKNAFKGITGKTTIKVPASKLAAYKKLFKKKGLAKNVKVTR